MFRLKKGVREGRRKKGVSPVIASTILIAVTVVVGMLVWSFVIGEAAVTTGAMGESTASNVNFLRERFVITNVAFNYPSDDQVTVWFYNNGAVTTHFNKGNGQIFIGDTPNPTYEPSSWFTTSPVTLGKKTSASISFSYTVNPGNTYYIIAVGEFGNVVTYYQEV